MAKCDMLQWIPKSVILLSMCVSSYYQWRYYETKIANGVLGENVYSFSPTCYVMGVQQSVNSMCVLLASCVHREFTFLGEIGLVNSGHISSNESRILQLL